MTVSYTAYVSCVLYSFLINMSVAKPAGNLLASEHGPLFMRYSPVCTECGAARGVARCRVCVRNTNDKVDTAKRTRIVPLRQRSWTFH
jgi:ribosomal protein S14